MLYCYHRSNNKTNTTAEYYGGAQMDYKTLYTCLFNHITDAIDQLKNGEFIGAEITLKQAQLQTEEMYLSNEKL